MTSLYECDANVFKNGHFLMNLGGNISPTLANTFCDKVNAELTDGSKIDWHFQGGQAAVLFIGDFETVKKTTIYHLQWLNEKFLDEKHAECKDNFNMFYNDGAIYFQFPDENKGQFVSFGQAVNN